MKLRCVIALCVVGIVPGTTAQVKVNGWEDHRPNYSEPDAATKLDWIREYMLFLERIQTGEFAVGYPAMIENLRSKDADSRMKALKSIGELGDPLAIPFVVPLLRHADRNTQVYAGLALEKIVSAKELARRGSPEEGKSFIKPPEKGELDMKPMVWIVFEMMTCGEPNLQAYAVAMAGYLDLEELRPIMEALRDSRHPAVTNKIDHFLGVMDRSER